MYTSRVFILVHDNNCSINMAVPIKVIATIGPASEDPVVIEKLIRNGVDVFRFNFKHNEKGWHADTIKLVKKISEKAGVSVGIMLDLPGPRIRLDMDVGELDVKKGDLILISEGDTKEKSICISHPKIVPLLEDGQKIVADDGAFVFRVEKLNDRKYLRSESEGTLKNNKSINIIGLDSKLPPFDERDMEGLRLAKEVGVDFIALSSVKDENDIKLLRDEMKKIDMEAGVISKVETKRAIGNIDKIIEHSDAVMVARGDLGVEIPIEQVPFCQKMVVKKCVERGVPVIVATQMLHSMVDNPFPTRAEISDVANAAYELADAVMLSAETAFGSYPLEAATIMRDTVEFNARKSYEDTRLESNFQLDDQATMVCDSAYNLYLQSQKSGNRIE